MEGFGLAVRLIGSDHLLQIIQHFFGIIFVIRGKIEFAVFLQNDTGRGLEPHGIFQQMNPAVKHGKCIKHLNHLSEGFMNTFSTGIDKNSIHTHFSGNFMGQGVTEDKGDALLF